MTFISYSQNWEDVLLWRALGHIANGFYIDVGANDPVLHSVTKAFYDAGWHGINIEPMPSYRAPFEAQRPRDINLTCAAGAAAGEITLFDVPAMNGWASTDAGVAVAHREQGYEVTETRVPMRTLADICAEHAPPAIHFLKIDVEGFEAEVLKGMDFARFRPWIVVVEATLPGTRETNHGTWEALVTDHRYRFAYFDGLNRYYVADEHAELAAALAVQANVFDDFVSHHFTDALAENRALAEQVRHNWEQVEAHAALVAERDRRLVEADARLAQRLGEADARLAEAARYADGLAQRLDEADARLAEAASYGEALARRLDETGAQLERVAEAHARAVEQLSAAAQRREELDAALRAAEAREHALQRNLLQADEWGRNLEQRLLAMYASTSWRITAPLRFIARRGPDSPANLARRKAKGAARRTLRWVTSQEALRRALLPVIDRSPWLQARVARFLMVAKSATADVPPAVAGIPQPVRELPQSARAVLADLKRAYQHPEQR